MAWASYIHARDVQTSQDAVFGGVIPDDATWRGMLQGVLDVPHRSSSHAPTRAPTPTPAHARLVAWARRAAIDACARVVAGMGAGLRLGPVSLEQGRALGADPARDRRTAWRALACAYVPGQPRARVARLHLVVDATDPDPARWTHAVLAAADAGWLPEHVALAAQHAPHGAAPTPSRDVRTVYARS